MIEMAEYRLSKSQKDIINDELKKFPKNKKRSGIIAALRAVQQDTHWLEGKHLQAVADYLEVPVIAVSEVATFYSMFRLKPVGRFELKVCASIACHLCGAHTLLHQLEEKLGIKLGEQTTDGQFSIGEAECLAACTQAPVLIINDQEMHTKVTEAKLEKILSTLESSSESQRS